MANLIVHRMTKKQVSMITKYHNHKIWTSILIEVEAEDFHSLFGHHIKTYVQSLSIIGLLVDKLSRLQAWAVSPQALEVLSLSHLYSLKTKISQYHYIKI